jgi:hypothetical protein
MTNKKNALDYIKELSNKDKRTIKRSKKDFVIFDHFGKFTLTNDLYRYRHTYQWGGSFGVINCIKNDIKIID